MTGKLSFLFAPNSIAVIGASETPGKVGYAVMNNIINSDGYKGDIYPINLTKDSMFGIKCYKSVQDVENTIDTAIICIPAKFVVDIVRECVKKEIKGLVIISAGFKEIGGTGAIFEQDLLKIVRETKIRVVGPNCLGIISSNINASFANVGLKKGHIAMVSQSGAMLTSILDWADLNNIGFSNCISLGNKADLDEVDFIEELAEDPNTKVILVYLESVNDGEKFLKNIPKAVKKKPVIILKAGISEAGSRAASSHTGALAGNNISYLIALEKCGVINASTITDLFDIARIFNQASLPKGKNFAIVTNAGGPGIVATDAFDKYSLGMTKFSPDTIENLHKNLPAEAAMYNPVDLIGDAPPERYKTALEIIFKEPDSICAGALVIVSPQAITSPKLVAEILIEIQQQFPNKLIVAVFMGGTSMVESKQLLAQSSIPCYEFPNPAIKAIKYMTKYFDILKLPDINTKKIPKFRITTDRIDEILQNARMESRNILLASETSEIFRIYGIKNPKTLIVKSIKELEENAIKIGYPMAMKVVSPDIIHKTDIGGVILNIKNESQARDAFFRITNDISKFGPRNARIFGIELQEMIKTDQYKKKSELIIGMTRDPQWGPLMMVGTGGIYTNYIKDVAFDLGFKYDKEDALQQLSKTKVYDLLKGVRGEPRSDIEAVLDVLMKLSQLVQNCPDIVELDINPLLVFEESPEHDAYSAVDIKITISKKKKKNSNLKVSF